MTPELQQQKNCTKITILGYQANNSSTNYLVFVPLSSSSFTSQCNRPPQHVSCRTSKFRYDEDQIIIRPLLRDVVCLSHPRMLLVALSRAPRCFWPGRVRTSLTGLTLLNFLDGVLNSWITIEIVILIGEIIREGYARNIVWSKGRCWACLDCRGCDGIHPHAWGSKVCGFFRMTNPLVLYYPNCSWVSRRECICELERSTIVWTFITREKQAIDNRIVASITCRFSIWRILMISVARRPSGGGRLPRALFKVRQLRPNPKGTTSRIFKNGYRWQNYLK